MPQSNFIEIDFQQVRKHGQATAGDLLFSRRLEAENRVLAVLADGMGSGIKANVLASLTGTMALRCMAGRIDIRRTAELIMAILPACKQRGIAYSTFTIADLDNDTGTARLIEYDNPRFLLLRHGQLVEPSRHLLPLKREMVAGRKSELFYSQLELKSDDRIVFFSDGVTQAGLGNDDAPTGWGREKVAAFTLAAIRQMPEISARDLARKIVDRALYLDRFKARDDITATVLYARRPRHLLLATGPPINRENDAQLATAIESFAGRRIICGGTTAAIVGRELDRPIRMDFDDLNDQLPPTSIMSGVDLVSEGAMTLNLVADRLADGSTEAGRETHAAARIVSLLRDSDIIHFLVGTKINDAHQEPDLPMTMDIRRNLVSRLRRLLEEKYCKETRLQYI